MWFDESDTTGGGHKRGILIEGDVVDRSIGVKIINCIITSITNQPTTR